MAQRRIGQMGWLDGELERRSAGRPDPLCEIRRLVDWAPFERLLAPLRPSSAKGEPGYPPLALFKVSLLQRWHDLSDEAMEAALWHRLDFLRFAGFSVEDETPDHTTIWRFRERLSRGGLAEALFAELARQLEAAGCMVKQGAMVDASLIASAARRPRMNEPKTSPQDPQARFGTSNERGRYGFGYKAHVAVDAGSGLVRAVALTPANVQEVSVAAALLPEQAGTVYADRGYDSAALRAELARRGFGDGIMRRGHRNRPLRPDEIARNHELSLLRRPVEGLFGVLKRSYGFARMRYFAQARNAVALSLACMAFNLRRWRVLAPGGLRPLPA